MCTASASHRVAYGTGAIVYERGEHGVVVIGQHREARMNAASVPSYGAKPLRACHARTDPIATIAVVSFAAIARMTRWCRRRGGRSC